MPSDAAIAGGGGASFGSPAGAPASCHDLMVAFCAAVRTFSSSYSLQSASGGNGGMRVDSVAACMAPEYGFAAS